MRAEDRHKRLEKTHVWKNREWFRDYLKSQGLDPNKHMSWFDAVYAGHDGDIKSFKFQTLMEFDEGKPHKDRWLLKSDEKPEDKAGKMMDDAAKKPGYFVKKRGQPESSDMKKHRKTLEKEMPSGSLKAGLDYQKRKKQEAELRKHPDYPRYRGTKVKREWLRKKMAEGKSPVVKPVSKPKSGVEEAEDLISKGEKPYKKPKPLHPMEELQKQKQKKLEREEVKKLIPLPKKEIKGAPIYAKDAPYDWDKQVKRIAGEKKLPPVKQPAKKLDRVGQIRQKLKGLIKPDRKYSRAEGLEKAKLYKELASLGKPSKFGGYWIKTYLGKKPKAVEKTPAPVAVVKKDPDKMPSLDVKGIIEKKKWKDAPRKDKRMVYQPREGEKKEPKVVKGVHAGKMGEKLRGLQRKKFRPGEGLELMRESHRAREKEKASKASAKDAGKLLEMKKQFEKKEPIKPKKESIMERLHRKYGKAKFAYGGDVKKYQGELKEEVGGMSSKGKDFLRKMLKKARGGEVEKYKGDLHKEVAGMGPEGKSYLRDKLHGREYEGKLKGKYKEDLDKELRGMSEPGKISLKKMVEPKDAWKNVRKELEPKHERAERNPKARKAGRHAGGLSLGQEIEGSRAEKARLREREGVRKSDIQFAGGGEALGREIEGSPAEKARLRESQGYAKGDINYAKGGEANWIQGAVKKPGALRAVAKREKLIKGDEKLSSSDLSKLAGQAKKKGNKLLAKRVALAKTFAKMRR